MFEEADSERQSTDRRTAGLRRSGRGRRRRRSSPAESHVT